MTMGSFSTSSAFFSSVFFVVLFGTIFTGSGTSFGKSSASRVGVAFFLAPSGSWYSTVKFPGA